MRLQSSMGGRLFAALACLALTACLSSTSFAANITVDCSGATPGAFISLQAAINSLDVTGPHTITVIPGACTENVRVIDHQRITIASSGAGATFNGSGRDVFTVAGSTAINFTQISAVNGNRGFVITRASEVTIRGASSSGNGNAGLRIDTNSTVFFQGASTNNGGLGINMLDSNLTMQNSQINSNGSFGIQVARSRASFDGSQGANTFNGNNGIGIFGANGAWISMTAPGFVQNNAAEGLNIEDGASVRLVGGTPPSTAAIVIDSNASSGIFVDGGQVIVFFNAQITNNGGGVPNSAGVGVFDNGFFATGGPGVDISANHGPGIDALNGGSLDLTATSIAGNAGDGIRLTGLSSSLFFPPNTNTISGNTGRAIRCDETSVITGDRTGLPDFDCRFSPFPPNGQQARHKGMRSSQHDND